MFGKSLNYSSSLSSGAGKDITIIILINKPQDRKWGWMVIWVNWVGAWRRARKRWSWEFEDFEKTGSWGSTVEERGFFSDLIKADQFWSQTAEMSWGHRYHKEHRAYVCVGGQYSMVSISFYDKCFSPCVAKDWRKKEINLFVPPVFVLLSICMLLLISLWLYNLWGFPPASTVYQPRFTWCIILAHDTKICVRVILGQMAMNGFLYTPQFKPYNSMEAGASQSNAVFYYNHHTLSFSFLSGGGCYTAEGIQSTFFSASANVQI